MGPKHNDWYPAKEREVRQHAQREEVLMWTGVEMGATQLHAKEQ